MKKKSLLCAILFAMAILLSACSSGNSSAGSLVTSDPKYPTTNESWNTGGTDADAPMEPPVKDSDIYKNPDAKIIRTADMVIQTTEFENAVAALNALTQAQGGYYETAEVNSGDYYDTYASRSGYYVVRVPKENFAAFRDGAGGVGHIYSLSENSQDVGETYYDTEARLATLTVKRDRLLALLEKAGEMTDIISLENALADVQYEIDMHTAALRKYDSLIDYATFRIRLNEVVKITEEPGVKESFGSRLLASLKEGAAEFGEGVQAFVLWLAANLIGVIIFAAVVVVLIVAGCRCIRRRKVRRQPE